MTLRLSVISEHGTRLGTRTSRVFGVHGGSIGRGTDNEWILPDPERYLSGKHARVEFREGSYVLIDTSSNGTYVNGAPVAIGKFQDHVLKDGDYLRLGQYELRVSIEPGNEIPSQGASAAALASNLDLDALLEGGDLALAPTPAAAGARPRNAYGQAVDAGREPAGAPAAEDPAAPWHLTTRPLKVGKVDNVGAHGTAPAAGPSYAVAPAAARSHGAASPAPFDDECAAGFAAFCRGAGVDPRTVTPDARGAALQLAGQLLRESVVGLLELNQHRSEFCSRFRITAPADEGPESPLNFSHGVDEALVRLLTTLSTRAGSVEAVRQNFRELKAQNAASITAMRAAFEDFLSRVDPKELEERFDRAAKRGVFGTQNRGKYWDLYGELFPGLVHRPADGFPHLFNEAFAKAFEARLRTLVPPRRSAFGADREPGAPQSQAVGDV